MDFKYTTRYYYLIMIYIKFMFHFTASYLEVILRNLNIIRYSIFVTVNF